MPSTLTVVERVKVGSQGLEVSKQGLGCMGMSAFYGPAKPEQDMIDLIRHAVDVGVTFFDTSDVYGPHTNEVLLGKAIKGIRNKVQIATKFGISTNPETKIRGVCNNPEYIQECVEGSLKRLDIDSIDLYYVQRVDKEVPIEITIGVLKQYVEQGKIKYLGLSETSTSDIRRAHAVHPITAVQLEWSLWCRDVEEDLIPTCRELGIGLVPYSPLGKGFFSGLQVQTLSDNDFRKTMVPRLYPENMEKNQVFFQSLVEIGKKYGKTAGQVALAWVQHQGTDVVPIPGTTKVTHLEENIGALGLKLSQEDLVEIEAAVPYEEIAGARCTDASMPFTWRYNQSPPLSSWKL